MSDGLFLSIFYDIAKDYPQIQADDKIVDNTCMQLVMNPQQFDIMVMLIFTETSYLTSLRR